MDSGVEKLAEDVEILAAMAEEMEEYLDSDVLFWRLTNGNMPMLTLGGYLMREHRLVSLSYLLDAEQQATVNAAVSQFNNALVERIVRLETKAHIELEARIRQWQEYLKDSERESAASARNYSSSVETRAMIQALLEKLTTPPYKLQPELKQRVQSLDNRLGGRWVKGEFVWPEDWKPAYPQGAYWWLYGTFIKR